MTFTNDQLVLLNAPLDGNSVKTRKRTGVYLSERLLVIGP